MVVLYIISKRYNIQCALDPLNQIHIQLFVNFASKLKLDLHLLHIVVASLSNRKYTYCHGWSRTEGTPVQHASKIQPHGIFFQLLNAFSNRKPMKDIVTSTPKTLQNVRHNFERPAYT